MSWSRTSEWWRTLREVSDELEQRRDGVLPWRPRYADVFGDRDGLRRALRYRWTLIVRAQGADAGVDRHRGLLLAIRDDEPVTAAGPGSSPPARRCTPAGRPA